MEAKSFDFSGCIERLSWILPLLVLLNHYHIILAFKLSHFSRGIAWSFRLGTHRKEGREPLGGDLGKRFFRGSEMPFPMFSRGKFHKSKHEKNADYSVILLFICQSLIILI